MLRGTLTLDRAGEPSGPLDLPDQPWAIRPTDDLIGVSGRIIIVGIPFTHNMHIWIRCPGRPDGQGTLRNGGQRYISGVWVAHNRDGRPEEPEYSTDHSSWQA